MPAQRAKGRVREALSHYRPRNDSLVDAWSFVHLATCAALALLVGPLTGFLVALVWEPLEILVLSPLLAKQGIEFGHEDLKNSMSDLAFNTLGVLGGYAIIVAVGWVPPLAPF